MMVGSSIVMVCGNIYSNGDTDLFATKHLAWNGHSVVTIGVDVRFLHDRCIVWNIAAVWLYCAYMGTANSIVLALRVCVGSH